MGERVLRLTIAYDGTGFREPVKLSVAGRTDAGVHARAQVVSFRTEVGMATDRLRAAVNAGLAPEVVVVDARDAPAGFDARFSATGREYAYRIHDARAGGKVCWPVLRKELFVGPPEQLNLAPVLLVAKFHS